MTALGVTLTNDGAEVALFSRHGTNAWLCLFDNGVERRIELTKIGVFFQGFINNIKAGQAYGFRVDGPWAPERGHRFDVTKLLIDPYAEKIDRPYTYHAQLTQRGFDTAGLVPKGIVIAALPDLPLRQIAKPNFIYELGVKSFTKLHQAVPIEKRGTIAALADPAVIAHLKSLKIDTIELMPINPWIDERHLAALGLHNAWGYNSIQFCAIDPRLAPGGLLELRNTCASLHEHNIQVILDIVFNHSGESDQFGPTLSFRGLDNLSYYAQTNGELHNDAGCGNTLALNQTPSIEMVLHSLRNFVLKCGVDGFRFDLATVLGRAESGFEKAAPLIAAIQADPILSTRILIAEPWDVGPGGYQLGNFPESWFEWNDQYRDDVRRFWRGDRGAASDLATRIAGSSDIFQSRKPSNSINFIAAHDGFTLQDLVTFTTKQNQANGEDNRDGKTSEVTWVGGDVRALLATLFFSRGTIMFTAGDEFGRTQNGNNNAYAQDNETTWLNWDKADNDLMRFVATVAQLRKDHAWGFADEFINPNQATWFGADRKTFDWSNPNQNFLGLMVQAAQGRFCITFNRGANTALALPKNKSGRKWQPKFVSEQVNFYVE